MHLLCKYKCFESEPYRPTSCVTKYVEHYLIPQGKNYFANIGNLECRCFYAAQQKTPAKPEFIGFMSSPKSDEPITAD